VKKKASLPVRLDLDEKRRLKEASERMGLNASAMIRLLVRSFVEEYDRSDGHLELPPRWRKDGAADGERAHAAESPAIYATNHRKTR